MCLCTVRSNNANVLPHEINESECSNETDLHPSQNRFRWRQAHPNPGWYDLLGVFWCCVVRAPTHQSVESMSVFGWTRPLDLCKHLKTRKPLLYVHVHICAGMGSFCAVMCSGTSWAGLPQISETLDKVLVSTTFAQLWLTSVCTATIYFSFLKSQSWHLWYFLVTISLSLKIYQIFQYQWVSILANF